MAKVALTCAPHANTGGGHLTYTTPRWSRCMSVRHHSERVGTMLTAAITMLPLKLTNVLRQPECEIRS
jgi:hypothetical protein